MHELCELSTNLKYEFSSQWEKSVGCTCYMYLSNIFFFIKSVQVFLSFRRKRIPFVKEMHRIFKSFNLESSTFEKGFWVRLTDFSLMGVIFALRNLFRFETTLKINKFEDLLRQPWYIFKFIADKNIISKRENLKTKE